MQSNPSAITWKPSSAATVGWIWGADNATSTNSFLTGDANQTFVSVPTPFKINFFGAITHGYGGSTAFELCVGSPGPISFGVQPVSHSTPIIQPNK